MKHLGTQTLETKRLILRKMVVEDIPIIFQNWCQDKDVCKFLTWKPHQNVEETKSFVSTCIQSYQYDTSYQWVIQHKDTNEVIGNISAENKVSLGFESERASIGYCMMKSYWNQGYMSEALERVLQFLLLEVGFHRVESYYDKRNPASGRVMHKAGMKYEGCKREGGLTNQQAYCDIEGYAILSSDLQKES